MQLTSQQTKIHQHALSLVKIRQKNDEGLVQVLQDVERLHIHKAFEKDSLFLYATEILGLEKSVAYPLITIARKARFIPELKSAMSSKTLTVSKASRIVSSLDSSNASELIEFAKKHTQEEIDFEVAKRNPKAKSRDRVKPISGDFVEVKLCMPKEVFTKLKRVESLEAQKGNPFKWADVLNASLEVYLAKNDPVRKAERSMAKKEKATVNKLTIKTKTNSPIKTRTPLTAEQKHAVFLRDKGRCTHVSYSGSVCGSDKWIEIHHIIPVAQGGTNDIENLTTLCSEHHDLVHQMSLPLEGQVTWLRSPQRPYISESPALVNRVGAARWKRSAKSS